MGNKEKSLDEVYGLIETLFEFTKINFELTSRRLDLLGVTVRGLHEGQAALRQDIQDIKEDIGGIAGAIAELVDKDEEFDDRIIKLETKPA